MAIISSLIFGKSRGSIGNVTLATVKGQTIAKQKIVNPTPSNSAGQVQSRGKMANAVMAWQFLSLFLAEINSLRKSTESNYNAFVRLSKSYFNDIKASSIALAAYQLCDQGLSLGNGFVVVDSITETENKITVDFATGGLPFTPGIKAHIIAFNSNSGISSIAIVEVSEQMWNNEIVTSDLAIGECNGAYIVASDRNKCSNIKFSLV